MHRTTPNLERDAADAARRHAAARGICLREVNGPWVFDLPPGSPRVTSEDVHRALDD